MQSQNVRLFNAKLQLHILGHVANLKQSIKMFQFYFTKKYRVESIFASRHMYKRNAWTKNCCKKHTNQLKKQQFACLLVIHCTDLCTLINQMPLLFQH